MRRNVPRESARLPPSLPRRAAPPQVRARLCQLRKDTLAAEAIFVEQGKVDEAIEMYQTLQM